MEETIITIVSGRTYRNPVTGSRQVVDGDRIVSNLRAFAATGLPLIVVHSETKKKRELCQLCEELDARYMTAEHNTYYGGGINWAIENVHTEAVVYASSRRTTIIRSDWVDVLTEPLANPAVAMAGSIQPCFLNRVTDKQGVQNHVQGGLWAARTQILQDVPFGVEFPQVYADVAQSFALRSCGYLLADVPEIKSVASGVVPDDFAFAAVSDYR